ncbi:MAG TPA: hypothetical protein VJA83_00990, partial [Sulfuricurvum sp.]|nr:hypothetical protein [Sulfuricurvum sp.]
ILLDEPTNMMDSLTEEKVKHNLKEVLGGKTVILVTHKTSLLDLVDRLMVVEEGKIVADGPKEDVLKKLAGGK